ncbi:MAG: glutamate synthase [Chloroflexi bacterium]|nr:MAG: glutamate synthase [Chloroflexota bacterium]
MAMDERDACGLVAIARKDGRPDAYVLGEAIEGMRRMSHRSGTVDGEGDGAGVLTDIPRALWALRLEEAGRDRWRAFTSRFAVAHLFVPGSADEGEEAAVRRILAGHRITILLERRGTTWGDALGPRGRVEEPRFWQLALLAPGRAAVASRALYEAGVEIERLTASTVVSLSRHTAVYKLRGGPDALLPYFDDLRHERFATSMAFGHDRYATNTSTSFERVQPFAAFAHNGEIDTIGRLREEALSLRLPLSRDGSDSQDVDAILRALVLRSRLTPIEAIELLFPPIVNEIRRMSPRLQDLYTQARATFGPFAQGPAAFLARVGDTCLFGVDALGLRPLWHVETDDSHIFASERGFVPLSRYVRDPYPLGPGQREALRRDATGWRFIDEATLRERFAAARESRGIVSDGTREHLDCGGPTADASLAAEVRPGTLRQPERRWEIGTPPDELEDVARRREQQFAALGFEPDDLRMAQHMAETASEPIGSLGWDGPLAALSHGHPNLADHIHETVAVVTNPAIDREREIEHFSTRVVVGPRPAMRSRRADGAHASFTDRGSAVRWVELRIPILLGGHAPETGIAAHDERDVARRLGTWCVEDLVARFTRGTRAPVVLEADRDWEEHPADALARLGAQACRGVRAGAALVVVQDRHVFAEGRAWVDPLLVVAAAHRALVAQPHRNGSLRRACGLVLSAGSIRNLHDLMVAIALGADAVNPYLLTEYARSLDDPDALPDLVEALRKGIEKVISTLGMHELRGYGRQLSAIGLSPDVARLLGIRTFFGAHDRGLTWERIAEDGLERAMRLRERSAARVEPPFRVYPRLYKSALLVANGEAPYETYAEKLRQIEEEHPASLRHLIDLARPIDGDPERRAITKAGEHAAPMYISSMSFGSQGETAYRAYAEAMARMDLLCVNGEGGELPDLIGKYPRNRGQQIASGRFGVSALLANSSDYLEIKIGQGAKPGEGGHLPARKVSVKVALARNAKPGVDLISPSNNHDIYSIEDLAQVVHELKTVNPRARVSVKVPVVPDIGIIAVGIAKSGADIVTLSGYDGGTGAARMHALRRAGLPAEIGVVEAHRALVAAGMRDEVEIWCDGGMKSALDVVKMLCLGADRVGFGTLAMVAIGCTICRGCQLDTCHVGIATQIESAKEATERGLKRFEPQEFERAVEQLCRMFGAMQREVARIAGHLGVARTDELVGRTDLLTQVRGLDRVDLSDLLTPAGPSRHGGREVRVLAVPRGPEMRVAAGEDGSVAHEIVLGSEHRFVATANAGQLARQAIAGAVVTAYEGAFRQGSVAGNGLGAYATEGVSLVVHGGAQDGAAKTALGGRITILKGRNASGAWIDGSVGKCFAYGAQRGRLIVQGGADARAGIRFSGADIVFGGDLRGFAFEYMTGGRAVVLGDPGRWICSGMSGGVVFVRHDPARGLDERGIRDRIAKGAKVSLRAPDDADREILGELLGAYIAALRDSGQDAGEVGRLLDDAASAFRVIRPGAEVVEQSISTE